MNTGFLNYIQNFVERIGIPLEAKIEIMKAEKKIISNESIAKIFSRYKIDFMNNNISLNETLIQIGSFSKELEIPEYTLHFIFLINCTDILLSNYEGKQLDKQIFWDSMEDFHYKLMECHEVMGVWGTFVAEWFTGFLNMKRFALGRFQYDEISYEGDTYKKNGIVLNKGDKVYEFHIPSSGKAFDKSARIASYRKAYEFFGINKKGGILNLVCYSWLLYKELENILPGNSNILDFMHDFDIVLSMDKENFDDSWRIFGKYYKMPLEQLPTDTSLRKAIVGHLASGEKMGVGFGIILFDGNKIINNYRDCSQ